MKGLGLRSNGAGIHYDIPSSDYIDVYILASGVEEIATVPDAANIVLFGATTDFYFRLNGTVILPIVDIVDGSGGELNPAIRIVDEAELLHLISPTTCTITLSYYKY